MYKFSLSHFLHMRKTKVTTPRLNSRPLGNEGLTRP